MCGCGSWGRPPAATSLRAGFIPPPGSRASFGGHITVCDAAGSHVGDRCTERALDATGKYRDDPLRQAQGQTPRRPRVGSVSDRPELGPARSGLGALVMRVSPLSGGCGRVAGARSTAGTEVSALVVGRLQGLGQGEEFGLGPLFGAAAPRCRRYGN
ncbi:hypothetical protein GCM10010278_76200 [Streptomyces melanogenes]|nr:hypothetical protein GCM10010278_76200 [Streptomyces melanogenes]